MSTPPHSSITYKAACERFMIATTTGVNPSTVFILTKPLYYSRYSWYWVFRTNFMHSWALLLAQKWSIPQPDPPVPISESSLTTSFSITEHSLAALSIEMAPWIMPLIFFGRASCLGISLAERRIDLASLSKWLSYWLILAFLIVG